MMDLDARYSALCDALRARGDVDALRAEVVLAGALAGLAYEGGAPPLRGDLAALRRAWDVLARDISVEMRTCARIAGTLSGREAAARERRWDAHVSVTDARWDDVMRGAVGASARDRSAPRVEAATGTSPQAKEGLLR